LPHCSRFGLDSQFQIKVEHVSVGCAQRGIENYEELTRSKDNPDWHQLVTGDADDDIDVDDDDELQVTDSYEEFDPGVLLPTSLEEVEAIQNLRFEPNGEVDAPTDLYRRADGSTTTELLRRTDICATLARSRVSSHAERRVKCHPANPHPARLRPRAAAQGD
jgi:hypothetical protein